MKKPLVFLAVFLFLAAPALVFADALTGPLVPQPSGGGGVNQYSLCDLVTLANHLINYAGYLAVFVATLMFTYGGVLYVSSSANEGNIKKAHSVFVKTFVGLILVLVAWLIVNIVLSVLTGGGIAGWTGWFGNAGCQYTVIAAAPSAPSNGAPVTPNAGTQVPLTTGTLSNNDALKQLHAAGVCGTEKSCLKAGASLQGIRQSTVNDLVQLHQACGCQFTITSGTDGSHAGGDYSHANGFKVDLRTSDNQTLTNFISQNFSGPASVTWGGVPSTQYTDGCGNKYTNEGDHWDVGYVYTCAPPGSGG